MRMMLFRRSFGKNLRFGLKVCSVAKLSCSKQSLNPTPNIHSQNIFKYFLKKKKEKPNPKPNVHFKTFTVYIL